jgi:hypothetical protein
MEELCTSSFGGMQIMQLTASGHLDFEAMQQHLNLNKSIQLFAGTSVLI